MTRERCWGWNISPTWKRFQNSGSALSLSLERTTQQSDRGLVPPAPTTILCRSGFCAIEAEFERSFNTFPQYEQKVCFTGTRSGPQIHQAVNFTLRQTVLLSCFTETSTGAEGAAHASFTLRRECACAVQSCRFNF